MEAKQNKTHLKLIFITIFLYLLGFGIMIPILPIISRHLGATPFEVGLVMASYSFMQFVFAPFWGRLSDVYGRRRILIVCLIGESVSYLIFALSSHLGLIILARSLAGFFGASISTASASVSDVTSSSERSKGMALVGAAFGLGFMFGPALGGGLAVMGEYWFPEQGPLFGMRFAASFVGLVCLITASFAFFKLQETVHLSRQSKSEELKANRFQMLHRYLKDQQLGPLIFNYFLNSFAMALMESTLILFAADRFSWGLKEVSFGFAFIGILSTLNQGFLVRKLLPVFGEKKLLFFGFAFLLISYLMIANSYSLSVLTIAMTLLSLGSGFVNPSLIGSISLLASQDQQGEALGTAQGTASLGRILGPALGGLLYTWHLSAPFYGSALTIALGLFILFQIHAYLPESAKKQQSEHIQSIGSFQFLNLIHNKVNFILIHDHIPFHELFTSLELLHIQRIEILASFDDPKSTWMKDLAPRTQDQALPVVLFKKSGSISLHMLPKIQQQYTGPLCYVDVDWERIKSDAKSS